MTIISFIVSVLASIIANLITAIFKIVYIKRNDHRRRGDHSCD